MHQLRNIALALAGFAATGFAADEEAKVHSLTGETFKDFVSEHDLVLAEFFAPWCGHCKALAPEYEAAATELAEKDIPLVKVDCTEESELCREYGIQGYPTMKVFRGMEDIKPYIGARKADSITSFMVKQSLPTVSTVKTAEGLEEFKALDKITIVGYFAADDKTSNETFTKIAEKLHDKYPFAATNEAALAEAEGAKLPSVVLYKDFDEKKDVFFEKFEGEALETFVKNAATPLVGEVAPATYASYMQAGIPLAYIFAETQEERDEFATMLKPVAKEHKGKINIATIDAKLFGPHAGNLNLNAEKFPAFAIQDIQNNKKYPYDQEKKITEKDIATFVKDVLDGKVAPDVKSEPIPEKQEGPVTVVVAKNYDEVVINNNKDVLVEFYAPWCGHCKALAPKYEELAALYADKGYTDKVTIAKVDATANDVPEDISGFPTIKLFPAGAKDEPVDFANKRTVEHLSAFVRDNGKHKVDALAAGEVKEEKKEETKEEKKDDKKTESKSKSKGKSSSSSSTVSTSSSATTETPKSEEDKKSSKSENTTEEATTTKVPETASTPEKTKKTAESSSRHEEL